MRLQILSSVTVRFLFKAIVALSPVCGFAQTAALPSAVQNQKVSKDTRSAAEIEAALANFRVAMAEAKSAARSLTPANAEQRLSTLNRSRAGSTEWHLELAQRLIHLATDLSGDGYTSSVRPLAERALHNTVLAESLAQTAELRAAAKTMTGFVQERFIGSSGISVGQIMI